MQIEPAYMDACSKDINWSDRICEQYGVSQDMGGWFVNYTIGLYYTKEIANNTLFQEYFLNDNGTSIVQSGFNNWITEDPDGTFESTVLDKNILISQSCSSLTMKVIAHPSTIYDTDFEFSDNKDQAFYGRFNYLCNLAYPNAGGDSTDWSFLWYIAGGIAVLAVLGVCCQKVYDHNGKVKTPDNRGLLGWDHM